MSSLGDASPGNASLTNSRDATSSRDFRGDLIYAAITGGDLMKARGMIMTGADINTFRDIFGRSILHAAVDVGAVGIIRLLLSNQAEINARDCQSRTAVHVAAERGNAIILHQLVEAKANLEVLDGHLESPVSLAAGAGHTEALRSLLKATATPDALDMDQLSAVRAGSVSGVPPNPRRLIEDDALPVSPLLRSLQNDVGHTVIEELLKGKASLNVADPCLNQPLHLACWSDASVQAVQLLLDHKADVGAKNSELRTPLHLAAARGSNRKIKKLINFGAEANVFDVDGLLPEQLAPDSFVALQLARAGAAQTAATDSLPGMPQVQPRPMSPPPAPHLSFVGVHLAAGSSIISASARRQQQMRRSARSRGNSSGSSSPASPGWSSPLGAASKHGFRSPVSPKRAESLTGCLSMPSLTTAVPRAALTS